LARVLLVAALALAGCGSDDEADDTEPAVTVAEDDRPAEVPPEAEPVETAEGLVWVWEDNAMVYGPCSILEPHEDDGTLHELVGRPAPEGTADFGFLCYDV